VTPSYHANLLENALHQLGRDRAQEAAIEFLLQHRDAIEADLRVSVVAQIPAFSESGNPDILPELARHGADHMTEMVRMLRGGRSGDFGFVRSHARRRAEQRFPLEAVLHAYRCGHKVFSRWLRDAVLTTSRSARKAQAATVAVADFAIEYTDAISTIAAAEYSAHARLLADVAQDQRAQLLDFLLDGYDEADGRIAKLLKEAGLLAGRQTFCVAVARSVDPAEMLNAARARRLHDTIEQLFGNSKVRLLSGLRQQKMTMVFSDLRRVSGWTAPRSSLAMQVSTTLISVGNAALIGVSNDAPSTSHIPSAFNEAAIALELADVTQRVLLFSKIPARRLLLQFAGDEIRRMLPSWAGALFDADDRASGKLVETLRAYANADMNILKTAQLIGVHANTVYLRLQRIRDVTGLEVQSFANLTELLIVADCRPPTLVA
jgi:hypothetical protein